MLTQSTSIRSATPSAYAIIAAMRLLCALLILAMLLASPVPLRAASTGLLDANADELVVRLSPDVVLSTNAYASGPHAADLNALLGPFGASAAHRLGATSATYRIRFRAGVDLALLVQQLDANPMVVYAEPNHVRAVMRTTNDPLFPRQSALANISAPEAWEITTGGAVPIAILDTGISPTHLDLKSKLLPGYDFLNRDNDPRDDDGHGTYTAGVAAAISNNTLGVAGVCWGCPIIPVKVLNRRGQGDDATIAEGLRWAVDQGARIISMSLGGPEDTRVLREAIDYAINRGVLVVAASGNGQADGNLPSFPAAYAHVLAVSATRADDTIAGFSTTGAFVDISAPGAGVLSTLWNVVEGDTYGIASGTSAACPFVAGAAGLLWSIRPDLTLDQLSDLLAMGADDEGPPGKDPEYGYGRLNIRRSLDIARDPNVLNRARIEGIVGGQSPNEAIVSLSNGQTARPDGNGFFRFDNLPAGTYGISVSGPNLNLPPRQVVLNGTALSVASVNFTNGVSTAWAFAPVAPPADGTRYFEQTGHTLKGAFGQYWQAQGGLAIFGYPISEEFIERSADGRERTVQYFQRHRLELHPENQPPYNVQLTRLGDVILQQQGRSWFDFPKGEPQAGCLFFEETGHRLCEPFLSYWRSHGLEFDGRKGTSTAESLALFGQPISEPLVETRPDGRLLLVQWFERARFEDHGTEGGVLLGLLGNELTR